MLPVMLDVTGRLIVVVGGGAVGSRKAAAALTAGATVTVIDPLTAAPGAQHVPEHYHPGHLEGAFLVFACATAEVNTRVVADAQTRRILVNSATDPATGDFALPSVVRQGELTLAISTGGAAPALARRIRERLEVEFDAAFAEWVRLLDEVRAVVLAEVPDSDRRRDLLDHLSDWPWLDRVRAEGAAAVRIAMLDHVRPPLSGSRN